MTIRITARELLRRGAWDAYCEKYGVSPWVLNEGRMDADEEVSITEDEARVWGLLDEEG